MKFYNLIGSAALGSRLRRLSHIITNDAKNIYELYDVNLQPHWFPVFFMLMTQNNLAVSEIAESTGLASSAVSKISKEMYDAGLVTLAKKKNDLRVTMLTLTNLGRKEATKLNPQIADVSKAINSLFLESEINLWSDLDAIEQALNRKGIHERVKSNLKKEQFSSIKINPFNESHAEAFRSLNLEWIKDYWTPEDKDFEYLDKPNETILKKSGYIAIVTLNGIVIGTCGLIKINSETYELVKMTVKKSFRRKGIGQHLTQHIIEKSRDLGAKTITLECNSVLTPAISLYEKFGFEYVPFTSSPYTRCNVQMKIELSN